MLPVAHPVAGVSFPFSLLHLVSYSSVLKNWLNVMAHRERAHFVFTGRAFYLSADLGAVMESEREESLPE